MSLQTKMQTKVLQSLQEMKSIVEVAREQQEILHSIQQIVLGIRKHVDTSSCNSKVEEPTQFY